MIKFVSRCGGGGGTPIAAFTSSTEYTERRETAPRESVPILHILIYLYVLDRSVRLDKSV